MEKLKRNRNELINNEYRNEMGIMVQKNSSNTENLRNKELIEELLLKLTSIIKDTHSVSILTELLINENITVTELIEKPSIKNSMKKSLLYARLKELESEGIITSTYKVQTSDSDRGYAVKSYSLKTSFFNLLDENLTDFSRKKPRETRLFGLYMIKSFLNREIDRLINSTNEDLIQNRGNIKGKNGVLVT